MSRDEIFENFSKLLSSFLKNYNLKYFSNGNIFDSIEYQEGRIKDVFYLLLSSDDGAEFKNSFGKSISIWFSLIDDLTINQHLIEDILKNYFKCKNKYEINDHQILFYFFHKKNFFLGKIEIYLFMNQYYYFINAFDLEYGWQCIKNSEKISEDEINSNIELIDLKSSEQKLIMTSVFDNFFFMNNFLELNLHMDRACINVFSLDELLINIFIRFKNDNILRNKKSSEYLWQNEIYSYFKKCTTKQTTIKPEEVVKNSRIDFVIEFELAKKEWGIEIYLSNVTNFGDNDKRHVERFFSNEGDYADLIENEKKCCIICICPNSYENKEKEKFFVEGLNSYLSKMNEKCIDKLYKNFLFYIIHLNYSCLNSKSYYTIKKTELKKNKKF